MANLIVPRGRVDISAKQDGSNFVEIGHYEDPAGASVLARIKSGGDPGEIGFIVESEPQDAQDPYRVIDPAIIDPRIKPIVESVEVFD